MNFSEERVYQAVIHGAGFVDLSRRAQLYVDGPDRVSFLHSMVSNDVQALEPGRGRYATFLTPNGKMIADFHLYKLMDRILIDVAGELAEQLQQSLERFVVMDEVGFTRLDSGSQHFAIHGPSSAAIVRRLSGRDAPAEQLQICPIDTPSEGWVICRPDILAQGFQILLRSPGPPHLREWLLAQEVPELPGSVLNTLCIEALLPRFGVDMDQNNYPMEARLDEAISLTKGCFVGQEVVAKSTYVGGVNRLLVGLQILDSELVPEPQSLIYSEGKKVGKLTSSCFSPRLRGPLALGYVRRNLADEGVEVEIRSDSNSIRARVCLEFPDSEGKA